MYWEPWDPLLQNGRSLGVRAICFIMKNIEALETVAETRTMAKERTQAKILRNFSPLIHQILFTAEPVSTGGGIFLQTISEAVLL